MDWTCAAHAASPAGDASFNCDLSAARAPLSIPRPVADVGDSLRISSAKSASTASKRASPAAAGAAASANASDGTADTVAADSARPNTSRRVSVGRVSFMVSLWWNRREGKTVNDDDSPPCAALSIDQQALKQTTAAAGSGERLAVL